MPEPFSWNAVVIGAWNLAILSPDGIRRRLFELPDGIPIELELAVDRPGQFRVGYEGMLIAPTSTSLEVAPRVFDSPGLTRACNLCSRALESLPETPVSAAGVNIRYRLSEVPNSLIDLVHAPIDSVLSDADFSVRDAVTKRVLDLSPGIVNLEITRLESGGGAVEFNFHRDSAVHTELRGWLQRVEEFITISERIADTIGVADVRREVHA
jgi:hypothetical protein